MPALHWAKRQTVFRCKPQSRFGSEIRRKDEQSFLDSGGFSG
jgi:hypothetical protein